MVGPRRRSTSLERLPTDPERLDANLAPFEPHGVIATGREPGAAFDEHQRQRGMRAAPLSLPVWRPRASLRAYLAIAVGIERVSETDDGSPLPVAAVDSA